jgi:single-strand DNA-binding protein
MGSVNRVILVGNLGQNPEVRFTAGNQPVAHFSVATSRSWKDKSGDMKEETEWHRVVVWGRQAESAGKYLSKGRQVYVEGRMHTRSWEGKDGQKHYTTEVVADNVVFLGGPQRGERPDPQAASDSSVPSREKQPDVPMDIPSAEAAAPDLEDMPF